MYVDSTFFGVGSSIAYKFPRGLVTCIYHLHFCIRRERLHALIFKENQYGITRCVVEWVHRITHEL